MTIGEKIASLRKEKALTQAKLAKLAGLSASTIAMYETNRRTPDEIGLRKLCEALDATAEQIMGDNLPLPAISQQRQATNGSQKKSKSKTTPVPVEPKTFSPSDTVPTTDEERQEEPQTPEPILSASDILSREERAALGAPSVTSSEPGTKDTNLSTLALNREEARIILFLRMYPDCLPFIESYITADPSKRTQLEKTWRLIREFQV